MSTEDNCASKCTFNLLNISVVIPIEANWSQLHVCGQYFQIKSVFIPVLISTEDNLT